MRAPRPTISFIALLVSVSACSTTTAETTSPIRSEPCDAAVDLMVDALQDFLDRLGPASTEDLPMLASADWWIRAYAHEARGSDWVIAYLEDDLADQEVASLADAALTWPGVRVANWLSKEEALAEARHLLGDQLSVLEVLEEDPDIIPRSIRVEVDESSSADARARFEAIAGVTQVRLNDTTIANLSTGLLGSGIREPLLREPTLLAEELGCSDVVLDFLADRAADLESHGAAGEWFIAPLQAPPVQQPSRSPTADDE